MAKRKRRGRRKGSRKSAMSHKRGRRGRRTSNPGAVGQVALGIGGFAAAGLLGALARTWIRDSNATTVYGARAAIAAGGAALTAMIPGDASVTMPLAAGMAANAGVQLMSLGATASGMTLSNQKFLGLTSTAAPSASAAASAVSAAAAAAAVPPSPIVVTVVPPGDFKDSKGASISVIPIATRKHTQEDGSVVTVEVLGVNVGGANIPVIDSSGAPWVRNPQTGELANVSASSLSGTYPPWAGYPGYDKRNFPQQVVSLPSQVAPHVQGYANYAPAMNGYANFAPAMSGWSPGYSD